MRTDHDGIREFFTKYVIPNEPGARLVNGVITAWGSMFIEGGSIRAPAGLSISAPRGCLYVSGIRSCAGSLRLQAAGSVEVAYLQELPAGSQIVATDGSITLTDLTAIGSRVVISAGRCIWLDSLRQLPEDAEIRAVGSNVYGRLNQLWRGQQLQSARGAVFVRGERLPHVLAGISLHSCRYFSGTARGGRCVLAVRGAANGLADSVKPAVEDLCEEEERLAARAVAVADVQRTGEVTREQYHAITGACLDGINSFLTARGYASYGTLPVAVVVREFQRVAYTDDFVAAIQTASLPV